MISIGSEVLESITYKLHYLESYVDHIEQFLKDESKKNVQGTADGSQDIGAYLDRERELRSEFAEIHRRSTMVSICSMIELTLNNICESIMIRDNLPIAYTDLRAKDQSFKRARKYLEKLGGISFPDGREWNNLLIYQLLRNKIVHNRGLVTYEGKGKNFIDTTNHPYLLFMGILGKEYKVIVLKDGFCGEMIINTRSFFERLIKEL